MKTLAGLTISFFEWLLFIQEIETMSVFLLNGSLGEQENMLV